MDHEQDPGWRARAIYCLRREAGISQQKLADILGVSRMTVIRWESGQSSREGVPKTLPEQAKLFLISLRIYENTGKVPPPFAQGEDGKIVVDATRDPLDYLLEE